jgi:high-affinity iron transporter
MLPTFVIGLREGLEAALIVSIIATFLKQQGRTDLLRWVFLGVATAILLCLGVGAALEILSRNLPQRQQEGLETVVGALAVGMVTYMVIWMRRHSRELQGTLETTAASALADGSSRAGRAMVLMAFLAVLREGFETVVFLLAAFNETSNGTAPIAGALLGIASAVVLGWLIYRGGVRLNLSKFFRATGLVLVLVAAGLVVTALHTAHEAGWLIAGQQQTVDLTWLVRPGTVQASLLTGMLGVQEHPVVIEVVGWLAYLIPVGVYVAWPPGRSIAPRRVAAIATTSAAAVGVAAVVLAIITPGRPAPHPVTDAGPSSIRVVSSTGQRMVVSLPASGPASAASTTVAMRRIGVTDTGGLEIGTYTLVSTGAATGRPATLDDATIARLNGGRLPLGIAAGGALVPVTYADTRTITARIEVRTLRVVDASWTERVTGTLRAHVGSIPLAKPVRLHTVALSRSTATAAAAAARADVQRLDARTRRHQLAIGLAVLALALLVLAGLSVVAASRRADRRIDSSARGLIGHEVSLT